MKVISSKNGSTRERVDVEADLLNVATWRPVWTPGEGGMLHATGRALVLSSRFGGERSTELHLTEVEALAIATAVAEELFSAAITRGSVAVSSHQSGGVE